MHEFHRNRLRERILQNGFNSLELHEFLEFLLFFPIPRRDTNPIAHALVERFGSIHGICNADVEELTEVSGVGEATALFLKSVVEFAKRYAQENLPPVKAYDTVSKIAQFFFPHFIGMNNEYLYMMMLDNRMGLIDCLLVSKGSVNVSAAPFRTIIETAIQRKASAVVLAHNHPNGLAIPSENDVEVTEQLNAAFNILNITLLEHLIIADNSFYPIMGSHLGRLRRSPLTGRVESGFFDEFYDVDHKTWKFPPIFGN